MLFCKILQLLSIFFWVSNRKQNRCKDWCIRATHDFFELYFQMDLTYKDIKSIHGSAHGFNVSGRHLKLLHKSLWPKPTSYSAGYMELYSSLYVYLLHGNSWSWSTVVRSLTSCRCLQHLASLNPTIFGGTLRLGSRSSDVGVPVVPWSCLVYHQHNPEIPLLANPVSTVNTCLSI